jgi:hypothetical protein
MRNASKTKILSAGILAMLGVVAAPITPAFSGPVPSAAIAVKTAAPDAVQDVWWRRGGGAFVAGLAVGAIGAAVFAPRYYGYGYGPAYGYAPAYGYYDAPYAYEGPIASYGYGYGYGPIYYDRSLTRQQRLRDRSYN